MALIISGDIGSWADFFLNLQILSLSSYN